MKSIGAPRGKEIGVKLLLRAKQGDFKEAQVKVTMGLACFKQLKLGSVKLWGKLNSWWLSLAPKSA